MENNQSGLPPRGPKPGGTESVAPMSRARAAVLERLRAADGTLSVETLAAETGQHTNTVREHLDALVVAGFATRATAARTGRGRPAWLYRAATPASRPAGYAALATALARQIAATSEDPAGAGDLAGRQWAHVLNARPAGSGPAAPGSSGPAEQRLARRGVVDALREAGFGIHGNADATDLTLTTCPIVEAARENQDVVCAVHLGLVKGLLEGSGVPEDGVRLVPFAAPGVCTLRLPANLPATLPANAGR
ncbi:helix-turn-helix transcriptional regulator [Specibacter sp. RAF43]|uniref:helix-turn-helix transcriptional regulator n=1 Tax=Specibacter sp. RAF43 TaxID=3233057 RepID=UPI003F9859FE